MSWCPAVTVAAVIRRDDRYLVVEECPDGCNVINQPAGHLEFGETLTEAVCREVREETARDFTPQGLVGVYQWSVPDSERSYLRFCFHGRVGEPLPGLSLDPEIIANHWLSLDDIIGGSLPPRSPLVRRCIEDALARPAAPLELLAAIAPHYPT